MGTSQNKHSKLPATQEALTLLKVKTANNTLYYTGLSSNGRILEYTTHGLLEVVRTRTRMADSLWYCCPKDLQ
jgi:hypothetical protein